MRPGQLLIAEVKTKSPFGWEAEESWEERFEIANQHGDIVAVHTDERWGGSFDLLEKARNKTNKPLLAKGIHETDEEVEEAISRGADLVLVVGRVPKTHAKECLIEPSDVYELRSTALNGLRTVWNERNLRTGQPKVDPVTRETVSFSHALSIRPDLFCQASYVRTIDDVHPQAKAVLVGTHLPGFVQTI